ncbi:hypothetical protein NIES208_00715 [[Limnothrix rosea] IAM M-220]|nr:hypothetical protein NIES208_00715 [[Limnothrix rosea] IAM M-220]
MFTLTEEEYRRRAKPELMKIFLDTNSHAPIFGSNVEKVKLIYKYFPPNLELINALIDSASNLGDSSLYLSIVNIVSTDTSVTKNWEIPFDKISAYLSADIDSSGMAYQLENVIYSPQGKWALLYTFEKYGVLAGCEQFIDDFSRKFPDIDRQILDYLGLFQECINSEGIGRVNTTWLGSFLKTVYGLNKARKLLEKTSLEEYVNIF